MKIMGIIASLLALMGISVCSNYKNVSVDEFEKIISDENVQLVDVRTAGEFASGHIKGAVNIDFNSPGFKQKADSLLDKNREVAVYCRSGRRSAAAASSLSDYKVYNLVGGIISWQSAGKPVL